MKITSIQNTFCRKPYIPWYVQFKFWYYSGTRTSHNKVYVTTDDFPNLKKCYAEFGGYPSKYSTNYDDYYTSVYFSDDLIELPITQYLQIYYPFTKQLQTITEKDDFDAPTPVLGYTKSNYPICLYYVQHCYGVLLWGNATKESYEYNKNRTRNTGFLPKKNQVVTYEIQIGLLDSNNNWQDYIPETEL